MANMHDKVSNVQEHMATAMERVGEAAQSVGQKFTDFFQGNPFETPVGRKIELATDATRLATENWGLNMEICDFVNCTNEGPRDAIRAIKKRLQTQMGKNNAVVMYTLTVLETCVKNCDVRFTTLVCQKEFVGELVKLVSAKYDAPQIVQERVLALIQSWADAFRGNPALSGVVEMYDELKVKGVEFPPTDLDTMAPIITPKQTVFPTVDDQLLLPEPTARTNPFVDQKTVPGSEMPPREVQAVHRAPYIPRNPSGPVQLAPDQMAKLRSELDVVHVNIEVLRELVAQMKPIGGNGSGGGGDGAVQQPPEDFHFVQELYSTCKEMQKRILDLIPVATNEEVTYELLSINDELNASFEKYDRCMANFNANGVDLSMVPSGSGSTTTTSAAKAAANESPDLIDLGPNAGKSLSEQFQAIDIHSSSKSSAPKAEGKGNEAFVHDQAQVGIHAVAFNKPEPMPSVQPENGEGQQHSGKKPASADDDGL